MYNYASVPEKLRRKNFTLDKNRYMMFTGYMRKDVQRMIKAGIIGATGYAGGELVRLLSAHKETEIVWYGSRS